MINTLFWKSVLFVLTFFLTGLLYASGLYKPFVKVDLSGKNVSDVVKTVSAKLESSGFKVIGGYKPYNDDQAYIIGITSDALKKATQINQYGAFGAVLRVAVTKNNDTIEVSYTDPFYIGYAYHIGNLSHIADAIENALGKGMPFGKEKGFSEKQLEKYHYMAFMPYFKDAKVIKEYASHAQAKSAAEQAMSHPDSDVKKIWGVRVDDSHYLYGVQLKGGWWKDNKISNIMNEIDLGTPKSTAALPWEILVSENQVVYLPGKYRIALMFPDLGMGTFMKISDIPEKMDQSAKELIKLSQ